MEAREQKIERLKKQIEDDKEFLENLKQIAITSFDEFDKWEERIKELEQELKELEKGNEKSKVEK